MTVPGLTQEYDRQLQQGLRLSGESKGYFIEGRISFLRKILPPAFVPKRVLDFGCGQGDSLPALADRFPGAEIFGYDPDQEIAALARGHRAGGRITVLDRASMDRLDAIDLCYVNGVFHHIESESRAAAARTIFEKLAPSGRCALFENNPWNAGTRLIMRLVPFDRGCRPISYLRMRRLLGGAGFGKSAAYFLFFFPRVFSSLRIVEFPLRRLPLGAQYCLLSGK